jgi:aminoglycoside 3-N-acetyltransferase
MPAYRDFVSALRSLGIERDRPVIAHASLSAFDEVQGGTETVLGALLAVCGTLIMPTFTYKCMVTPEVGPPDNGIDYGSARGTNLMAEFYNPDMPADRLIGVVAEALRSHPDAHRSVHPILSFSGINSDSAIEAQIMDEPFGIIHALKESRGWVLLLGVNHTVNTSIHYAEWVAGRKQFIRWALTPNGVVECPGFSGCSHGFQVIAPRLEGAVRTAQVGSAQIQAVPLIDLTEVVYDWITEDPLALLCERDDCGRCAAVRQDVAEVV